MTTAEKRVAVFKRQHLSARKALKQLHHDMHMTYRHPNDYDSEEMSVLAWLTDFIDKAHADEYYKKKRTREDKAAVARKKVEEELKNKIRDEATAESELLWETKLRAEHGDEFAERFKAELEAERKAKSKTNSQDEPKEQSKAEL
jgi:hypothetical protein